MMRTKSKPKNMLSGRYGLGEMKKNGNGNGSNDTMARVWIHLGVLGGGLALGYFSYPYYQTPLGMTLVGAAGSIVAVSMLLLVYDAFRKKSILEATVKP